MYRPRDYWEQRLQKSFNLKGVGHQSFSESYNQWLYRRKENCLSQCLKNMVLEGKDVLDLGCGTGFFVKWYLERGARVTGVDITDASVTQLRSRFPQGEFFRADVSDPGFSAPHLYDIVNIWDVVYHIVDPSAFDRAFENIKRSLKPGGLLLVTDFFGAPRDVQAAEHVRFRNLESYRTILEPKGFELLETRPLFTWLSKGHFGKLDNLLAPLYYRWDERAQKIPSDNISLAIWRLA